MVKLSVEHNHISEDDDFLSKLREQTQRSASQQKEISKYERIYRLRDDAEGPRETDQIWEDF